MRSAVSKLMWFVLGALVALTLLELALRLLPVTMGPYRTNQFERWPLQSSEPDIPYAHSVSWSMLNARRGTTNNYGHIAPFDYKKGSQPVIVIGDSYVESLMNDYRDTLQAQLGEMLHAPESVYGLGVSGLSASDYVALSRLARDEFAPSAAVFLMNDGDLSESLGSHLGYYFLVPDGGELQLRYAPLVGESMQKKVRKLVGDISIYRYFQVNLQFSIDKILKVFQAAPAPKYPVVDGERQRMVADWFLANLPASLGLPPECIVLLMDSDRYAIYSPELASPRKDDPEVRQYLIEQAQQLGFQVSDLDRVFRHRYERDRVKFDYWPNDRHWNRLGHGVGAEEAWRLLYAPGEQHRSCTKASRVAGK